MAITKQTPTTILLAGGGQLINDVAASVTLTPGHVVKLDNDAGTPVWALPDGDGTDGALVVLEQDELNKDITETYAADDLVKVMHLLPGSTFYGFVASGTYVAGTKLIATTAGTLEEYSSGAGPKFQALESKTVTTATRCRIEVL